MGEDRRGSNHPPKRAWWLDLAAQYLGGRATKAQAVSLYTLIAVVLVGAIASVVVALAHP